MADIWVPCGRVGVANTQKTPAVGIEPTTSGSGNRRASIAPRGPGIKPWSRWGSNPGPSPYQSDALPTELRDPASGLQDATLEGPILVCHVLPTTDCRCTSTASWCSGSTSDSKSDNGGSIPSEVTFTTLCAAGCISSPMAQSVARQAVNLQVAGSNPAGGESLSRPGAFETWNNCRRRQGSNLRMQSTLA